MKPSCHPLRLVWSSTCAALVLAALSLPSAPAATVTYTGAGTPANNDLTVAGNYDTGATPSPATPDTLQFNGTPVGNLVLVVGGTALAGAAGNAGITLNLTAAQTSGVSIDAASSTNAIRIAAVNLAAGAGPLTFGDGTGTGATAFAITTGGGAGTQIFTNNSTSAGTFNSDVSLNTGSGNAHIYNFAGTGNWVLNNVVTNSSGTVALTKTGAGTLALNAANSTYTVGTTIGAGAGAAVVRAGATQALGTGAITFDATGNGSAARLELVGGAAGISLANAIAFTARNNTSVAIENISGNTTLSGAVTLGAGGNTYTIQSDAGTLSLTNATAGTITVNKIVSLQGAGNGSVAGVFAGAGGVTKAGAGTWTLSGANTYTGPTAASAGVLLVNGSIATGGTANISNGAILGGSGTINAATIANAGGTLRGGTGLATASTLTIGNDLTLNSESVIQLALGTGGVNDHSTLARTAGNWVFSSGQAFNLIDFGLAATPGTYAFDNIITGLAADPGNENTWTVQNAGFTGTFTYDGANIELSVVVAALEPSTWACLLVGAAALGWMRQCRLRSRSAKAV